MSMRTGQTSKQAPHSDEAYGSESVCSSTPVPFISGLRIAPIGPG